MFNTFYFLPSPKIFGHNDETDADFTTTRLTTKSKFDGS